MNQPRARIIHELKIWPEYFQATLNGRKKFELRRNDRDYKVGDQLLLQEWDPYNAITNCDRFDEGPAIIGPKGYTGRELLVRVDYIMDAEDVDKLVGHLANWRVSIGFIIMSVSLVS